MLSITKLIEGVEEKYIPMLKTVNIPDFTKCIATFSGIDLKNISDEIIKSYLITWATNKFDFFELFNHSTRYETTIQYEKSSKNINIEILELAREYIEYGLWIAMFQDAVENKNCERSLSRMDRDIIDKLFLNNIRLNGMTITHFFKKYLRAPEELVTKLAKIFENSQLEANYTASIDPVDILTASENPYWSSCYRLETDNCDSHADGCMGALVDRSTIITYIWKNEGEFSLYGNYTLKSIRYKMMRQWVAFSEHMTSIHFNDIYPSKDYTENFNKTVREIIEGLVSQFINQPNLWVHNFDFILSCHRENNYGYNEYSFDKIYYLKSALPEDVIVYDEPYLCACGCGLEMKGSDDEGSVYNGDGFKCGCYSEEEGIWCEETEEYEDCDEDCDNCDIYLNTHPRCSLDGDYCEDVKEDFVADSNHTITACEHDCSHCSRWKEEQEENKEEE